MAQRTIYTCDRCGKESQDRGFLGTVIIQVNGYEGRDWGEEFHRSASWCWECLGGMGIRKLRKLEPASAPAPAPPSLEDFLRELVRDEIQNTGGS